MARKLKTPRDVIDELGGPEEVAARFGIWRTAVCNWLGNDRGRLPPNTYVAMQKMLERRGLTADPAIWGMRP